MFAFFNIGNAGIPFRWTGAEGRFEGPCAIAVLSAINSLVGESFHPQMVFSDATTDEG
jgi:hypothetical protein